MADNNGGSDNHTMASNHDESIDGQNTKAEITKYFFGTSVLNPITHLNRLTTTYLGGTISIDPTEGDVKVWQNSYYK